MLIIAIFFMTAVALPVIKVYLLTLLTRVRHIFKYILRNLPLMN
jgi:hypothetical protein